VAVSVCTVSDQYMTDVELGLIELVAIGGVLCPGFSFWNWSWRPIWLLRARVRLAVILGQGLLRVH
jgi:hypothetical protein